MSEVSGGDPMYQGPLNLMTQTVRSLAFTYRIGGVPALTKKTAQDCHQVLSLIYRELRELI